MAAGGDVSYGVTLERGTDGTFLAWVDDVPGCAVRGRSRDAVLDHLPAAIRSFLVWAGETDPTSIPVEVVEEVDSAVEAEEDTELLVSVDRAPLTRKDWQEIDRLLGRSRGELLELLQELTEEELSSRREGSERTVREEIEQGDRNGANERTRGARRRGSNVGGLGRRTAPRSLDTAQGRVGRSD